MNIFKRNKGKKAAPKSVEQDRSLDDEDDDTVEENKETPSSKKALMKQYLKQAQSWTAKEANEAKKELQKAAGLGARPDVVPEGEALVSGEPRTVEIGWVSTRGSRSLI